MSADNGIYIGKFGNEYRVIHAQAIENVNYQPDYDGFNSESVVLLYKNAPRFKNPKDAMTRAKSMAEEILSDDFCPVLEYGICEIDFLQPFKVFEERCQKLQDDFCYGFPNLNTDKEIRDCWTDNPDFFGEGMAQDAAIKMKHDIEILLQENSDYQKMLRAMEWRGQAIEFDEHDRDSCPLCGGIKPSDDIKCSPRDRHFIGHRESCAYVNLNKRKLTE